VHELDCITREAKEVNSLTFIGTEEERKQTTASILL